MISNSNKLLLATSAALGLAGTVHAEGIYGTAILGKSMQASDSEPYGDNIAADPDFPGQFDTDGGGVGILGMGYALNSQIRLEGRVGQHRADFNSQRFGTGARAGEEYILDGDIEAQH